MSGDGDAMATNDRPARRRVPVREERLGFRDEWGWTIIFVVVRTIVLAIIRMVLRR